MTPIGPASPISPYTALRTNQRAVAVSMERMATGRAINRGRDNPSGLIASERFAADISANSGQIRALERSVLEGNSADAAPGATPEQRATIGTGQRSDESMARVLENEQINTTAALSQTRDTDYAKESSEMARASVLSRASIYTILAARQSQAGTAMALIDTIA